MNNLTRHNIDEYSRFIVQDPFNPHNTVEGIVSLHRDHRYGALSFEKVNGAKTEQPLIFGTPKLFYPVTPQGNYLFPSASNIFSFKKYDGTNVFMYRYRGTDSRTYISYKVRRFPFLRGNFLPMWKKILKMHPTIKGLFGNNPDMKGFAFELYGSFNPHLISYKNELDIALLFGLKNEYDIVPNTEIDAPNIPKAEILNEIKGDYVWSYEEEKRQFDEKLKIVNELNEETGEQMYEGEEGSIWYLKEKRTGLWRLFKCKASEIEKIHRENTTIENSVIKATAINTLEEFDDITVDRVKEYLNEEFPMTRINASIYRIEKIVRSYAELSLLKKEVAEILKEEKIGLENDLPDLLRLLSTRFPKNRMAWIFIVCRALQRQYKLEQGLL